MISCPTTALDRESSSEETQATTSAPLAAVIPGQADEPPTDLRRSPNKQCVLYPTEDSCKAEIFRLWWDSTPYGVHYRTSKRQLKWGNKAQDKKSVWLHFVEGADVMQGAPKALCKYCWRDHPHPTIKNSGTSTLRKHLNSGSCQKKGKRPLSAQLSLSNLVHKKVRFTTWIRVLSYLIDIIQAKQGESFSPLPSFSPPVFHDFLLSFILEANLPFRLVEHASFRKLLSLCRRDIHIPHRTYIKTTLLQRFEAMQKGLLRDLPASRKISLALDCWTSPNHYSFLGITGYFVSDDWRYCEVLLAFKPLRGKHSGSRLAEYVMETLAFYNLTKRLLTITADNAKNNSTLRKQLRRLLQLEKENVEWDHRQGTIRCMSHTIQLSVVKFLSILKIQSPNSEPERVSKNERYDHISFADIGYNNVYVKVCTIYHINLLTYHVILPILPDQIPCDSNQFIAAKNRAIYGSSKT